ncbi:MAG: DUF116 domain-containing protein [Tindallia sp. MSAO_Bac2]|nr:MAG: DUF116 domain-containing protein [Tindallia sp. MSAO_Bac2]
MMNEKKHSSSAFQTTISLLLFWLLMSALLILLVSWLISGQHLAAYLVFNGLLFLVILFFAVMVLVSLFTFFRIWYNKTVPKQMLQCTKASLNWIYPLLKIAGKLMKKDKDDVRKAFTLLNNRLMMSESKKYKGQDILLLTPHCLQKAHCSIKVTNDIELCQECGVCNVGDLKYLQRTYGVRCDVVTGGTLARRRIKEKKPKLIIAVACERDLVSGLMDIKNIPVYAIINDRPEGPCYNTVVQKEEVENTIKHFMTR